MRTSSGALPNICQNAFSQCLLKPRLSVQASDGIGEHWRAFENQKNLMMIYGTAPALLTVFWSVGGNKATLN